MTAHSVQIINIRCMCRAGGVVLGAVKVARFLALAYSATDQGYCMPIVTQKEAREAT